MRRGLAGPALAAVSSAAGGCAAPFSTLLPAGPEADSLASLGWWISGLCVVIVLVMSGLVLAGARRRRGSLDEHLPIDAGGGRIWILVGGVLVPVVVGSGLFLLTVATLRGIPGDVDEEPDLEVEVVAHQWWWEIRYLDPDLQRRFSTANELHVPAGRKVLVTLESADVIHSFWVPRLHGKLDLIPGHTNHLMLEASEPGVYRGECAEFCGVQHTHMRFLVVAQPAEEFRAWAARQRRPAAPVEDPRLVRGREAFEQHACGSCHTIRGTRARGGVAPDLTHFGSRRTLGAAMYPNTRARLQAWIVNAQAMKPGIRMPAMDVFDGETLNALTVYLQSLK